MGPRPPKTLHLLASDSPRTIDAFCGGSNHQSSFWGFQLCRSFEILEVYCSTEAELRAYAKCFLLAGGLRPPPWAPKEQR